MKIIKNLILFLMVIACVFLSSQVWLQIPDFLSLNKEDDKVAEKEPDINLWNIVKPNKYILKSQNSLKEFYLENDIVFWQKAVENLEVALKKFSESQYSTIGGEFYPEEYVMLEFENKLPLEIFTGKFGLSKDNIKTKLNYIEKIVFGLNENNNIYIYNGDSTVIIKNSLINNAELYKDLKTLSDDSYVEYIQNIEVGGEIIPIPIPNIKNASNPVFVQSELDVKNKAAIEDIAKEYFKNSYDYVRKSEDIEGDILYNYKNEKVLKISSEGLLDFFDSNINIDNSSDVYESLMIALKFAMNFLDPPPDMYLSEVNVAQNDGNFGYEFVFTYRILNKPILFSKVRESSALEVEVIGNNVVSYKRFIRNRDTKQDSEMKKEEILSFEEVLENQLSVTDEGAMTNTLKVIDKSMVKDIENVYLAYFDYARSIKEQHLIVVWVVEIKDKVYIFNAITGSLLEEQ